MTTAESVKAKLQGQIDKINATTGGADTTLASAVDAVIAGFGQGGAGGASGVYMAQITPATDTNQIVIEHNLNCDVRVALLYADELTVDAEAIGNPIPVLNMYVKTELDVQLTTSLNANEFTAVSSYNYNSKVAVRPSGVTSSAYLPSIRDANTFAFIVANTAASRFRAGQTLNAIIVAGV